MQSNTWISHIHVGTWYVTCWAESVFLMKASHLQNYLPQQLVFLLEFHVVCYLNLLPALFLFNLRLSWLHSQCYIPFLFLRTPALFLSVFYLFFRNPWKPSGEEYPLSLFYFLWNELGSTVMMEKRFSPGSTVSSLRPFLASWIVLNWWAPSQDFMPGQQGACDFSVNLKSHVTLYH